jgi:ribose transport system substrate-binding protein
MKLRVLCIAFAVLALLLAGCARAKVVPVAQPPTAVPCPTSVPVEAQKEAGIYYFVTGNWQDPFYIPGIAGLKAAGKDLGIQVETAGPMDANQAEVAKAVEAVIARDDTAGIMLYPMEAETARPLSESARAKGIAVVNGAADTVFKARHAFIGYDNVLLGEQAAEWVAKGIGGKGVVGSMGNGGQNVVVRQEAFDAYLKAHFPDIKVVTRAQHDASAKGAAEVMDAYLVANPDMDVMWFADGLAGQMSQLWAEKQATGVKTKFIATDMPPATLKAVKDGIFAGSVGQDTYTEAYWSVVLMHEIHLGHRVPDSIFLSAILIDSSNVDQYIGK